MAKFRKIKTIACNLVTVLPEPWEDVLLIDSDYRLFGVGYYSPKRQCYCINSQRVYPAYWMAFKDSSLVGIESVGRPSRL
ncbi:MAG: hypothetical protein JRN15_21700 [Nitrososphaerota archaeon]|nr:hypothetical protein [Nitrososphaerota archaeon]